MTFVNPLLLAGTLLIAVPIVLHLIMRRKPRLFEFPALRFVQLRHEKNQRRLRLQHLILLLLRAGAVALLAFALARPSLQHASVLGDREAPVAAALVIDTSPRMELRHENRTRLEAAQELGQWLLRQLPAESRIAVIDSRPGPAAFQVDQGAARQRIDRVEVATAAQPLARRVAEAARLLDESELPRREIYVFTDMTRSAWAGIEASGLPQRLAALEGGSVYLIDVGVERPVNYALDELRLSAQVLSSRSALRIETAVHHSGPGGSRPVELFLLDEQGTPQKRDQRVVTLPPDGAEHVEFVLGALDVGVHQGFLRLVGQDALAADDARYFSVEVKPPWPLLVVAPRPAERHALFLTEAVAPAAYRRTGQARFECRVIATDELGSEPLDQYAAVCLLDPEPLEPGQWRRLADFAAEGGGVGLFLGRRATPLAEFNQQAALDLLPAELVMQVRRPEGEVHLAPRGDQHPVLAGFRGISGMVPWDLFPVFQYWQLGEPAAGTGTVIALSDGRPALVERSLGSGRVLVMTTPLSDLPAGNPWNLLPAGEAWPFVILANQMVSYLVGGEEQQLNYTSGQTAVLPLDGGQARDAYLLATPDGMRLSVSPDPARNALAVSATEEPGNYRLEAGGRAEGVRKGFSVNLPPALTELARLDPDDLSAAFGEYPHRLARGREQIDREISTARTGRELFPALILLLAGLLAVEHVVANRFYRETAPTDLPAAERR